MDFDHLLPKNSMVNGNTIKLYCSAHQSSIVFEHWRLWQTVWSGLRSNHLCVHEFVLACSHAIDQIGRWLGWLTNRKSCFTLICCSASYCAVAVAIFLSSACNNIIQPFFFSHFANDPAMPNHQMRSLNVNVLKSSHKYIFCCYSVMMIHRKNSVMCFFSQWKENKCAKNDLFRRGKHFLRLLFWINTILLLE